MKRICAACVLLIVLCIHTSVTAQIQPPRPSDHLHLERDARSELPMWTPVPVLWGESHALPLLRKLLNSDDADSRARSAFLLGQIGAPEAAEYLAARLNDPERAVRVQCGVALACLGDSRGVPTCAVAASTEPDWMRYYAVYGLWRVGTPRAIRLLKQVPTGGHELVDETIKNAIGTPYVARKPVRVPKTEEGLATSDAEALWISAANAYTMESDLWWHEGNYLQSIRCNETAILFDPTNVESYAVSGWLLWSLGNDPAAVNILRRGVRAAPEDPESHYELGHHFFNTKRYAQAEAPLKRAVELGGRAAIRRTYAHCLEKLGKPDQALAQWESLVKDHPEDTAVRFNYERLKGEASR